MAPEHPESSVPDSVPTKQPPAKQSSTKQPSTKQPSTKQPQKDAIQLLRQDIEKLSQQNRNEPPPKSEKPIPFTIPLLRQLTAGAIALGAVSIVWHSLPTQNLQPPSEPDGSNYPPLVKQGGDPYIRALMRTISASEANGPKPYSLLYGGEHFQDFSKHPDRCVSITVGINTGDCTTAAGRYQFITTTWQEQAEKYHPDPSGFWLWHQYSFEPQYQDEVVYRWLSDPQAWGVDLSGLLREGQILEVLEILSPVWTSLGYGIETNDMSDQLPQIYEVMLQEELNSSP